MLLNEFVKFGPIASVKVMWPRSEEEHARGCMSGFVAFMTRKSAEDAKEEMNGAGGRDRLDSPTPWLHLLPFCIRLFVTSSLSSSSLSLHSQGALSKGWICASAGAKRWPSRRSPSGRRATWRGPRARSLPPLPNPRPIRRTHTTHIALCDSPSSFQPHQGEISAITLPAVGNLAAFLQPGVKPGTRIQDLGPGVPRGQQAFSREAALAAGAAELIVHFPRDPRQLHTIDTMAAFVAQDGCPFEQEVMRREASNPDFRFLFDFDCAEHAYYRWRVFSLAQGDLLGRWREEPFQMLVQGSVWVPPKLRDMPSAHPAGPTAAQRADARGGGGGGGGDPRDPRDASAGAPSSFTNERELSQSQRDEFEDMLRSLTVDRASIRDGMAFALDNADAAREVADTLAEALSLEETPVPTKVARLFLVSDILHNSSAPVKNASAYRSHFEARLPEIFEALADTLRAVNSRITGEAMKKKVLSVLRCWGDWFIFSEPFLQGLQITFLKGRSWPPAPGAAPVEHPKRVELELLPPDELERRCRRNGLSSAGGAPACVARLLALEVFTNGDAAAPAAATAAALAAQEQQYQQPQQPQPQAPVSRWETVEEDPPASVRVRVMNMLLSCGVVCTLHSAF